MEAGGCRPRPAPNVGFIFTVGIAVVDLKRSDPCPLKLQICDLQFILLHSEDDGYPYCSSVMLANAFLKLTPEAPWRHCGMLVEGGGPTWRG